MAEVSGDGGQIIRQTDVVVRRSVIHGQHEKRQWHNEDRPNGVRPAAMLAKDRHHGEDAEKGRFPQAFLQNENDVEHEKNRIKNFLAFAFNIHIRPQRKEQTDAEERQNLQGKLQRRDFIEVENVSQSECKRNEKQNASRQMPFV